MSPAARRRGIVPNYMEFAVSALLGTILALWATVHLGRTLGVYVFGQFSLARSIGDYMLLVMNLGFTVVGTRSLAARPHMRDVLVARTTMVRASVAGVAVIASIVVFLFRPGMTTVLVAIMSLSVFANAFVLDWVFAAEENTRVPSIVRLAGRALYALVVVLWISGPEAVNVAAWALVVEGLVVAGALLVSARPRVSPPVLREAAAGLLDLVRESLPIGMAQAGRQLKTNADVLLLAAFGTATMVGYYSAAYRLVMVVNMLAGLFATVLLPSVARRFEGDEGWREEVGRGLRLAAVGSVLVATVAVPVAPKAMLTLFGPDYLASSLLMPVLMFGASWLFMSAALGNVAVAVGKQGIFMRSGVLAVVFNIACNIVLIPRLGAVGAAWATLLTETLLAIYLLLALWDHGVSGAFRVRWIVRLGAMGLGVFAATSGLAAHTNWAIAAGVGAVSFACLVVITGTVKVSDVSELGRLATGETEKR